MYIILCLPISQLESNILLFELIPCIRTTSALYRWYGPAGAGNLTWRHKFNEPTVQSWLLQTDMEASIRLIWTQDWTQVETMQACPVPCFQGDKPEPSLGREGRIIDWQVIMIIGNQRNLHENEGGHFDFETRPYFTNCGAQIKQSENDEDAWHVTWFCLS